MPAPSTKSLAEKPVAPLIVAAVIVAAALVLSVIYLKRPSGSTTAPETAATAEAKAYVRNLQLSDVHMKASENFMRQQVVEITGNLANNGPRTLESASVYCLFYGLDGREIHRERVSIIQRGSPPLKSGELRAFRLPFDSLPDGWNQALPRMIIAQITFAS